VIIVVLSLLPGRRYIPRLLTALCQQCREAVVRGLLGFGGNPSSSEERMTPENQRLVRGSFAKVAPIAPAAAAMFYDRLFALDPSLRPLFKGDMQEQGRKLMAMIGTAVANLDRLETILPAVQDLGRRHATYGVQPAHYDTVATALLWTLEQGLGPDFTPATRDAWVEAYTTLAGVMIEAAAV
jgi:hemoglobin-like flavoprotein